MMGWIPGTRLYSGETIWVTAQLVLFIYYLPDDEPLIGLAPSGGLVRHITMDLAVCHALDELDELVERDAINLRWHARVPLDRIVMDVEPRDAKVPRQNCPNRIVESESQNSTCRTSTFSNSSC